MQKYQRTYLVCAGYDLKEPDILNQIKSELSGQRADDIHHIKFLMTGIDRQDYPFERLIALTRDEHTKFGDKKQYFDYLLWVHYIFHADEVDIELVFYPNSIFGWTSYNEDVHANMYDFYQEMMKRKYYVEVWEMPDHCILQVYNSVGNMIKEFRKPTKFEIFEKPLNIPKTRTT